MNPATAIVFDLDDTLFPERAFAFSGFAAVARAYEDCFGPAEEATVRMRALYASQYRGRVFNTMLEEHGRAVNPALVDRMIDAYHDHVPTIDFYDDAREVIDRVRGRHKLGLITDGPAKMQHNKVTALGLDEVIDQIILTAELGPGLGKPHLGAFELMAKRLASPASSLLYVADNASKDFVAPNALGWDTVQVVRADGVYRGVTPPPGGQARRIIHSLRELLSETT